MAKKILIALIIGLILSGGFGLYRALKYSQSSQQPPKELKAPEITIRLIEGWTNKEIASYLEKEGIVPAEDFLKAIKNFNPIGYESFLPKKAKADLQGFLYPDTYRLFESLKDRSQNTPQAAAEQIITKLLKNFQAKLPEAAESLAKKQGLDLYEAVTLASIIEKETGRNSVTDAQRQGLDEERKIIAGIFYNRLAISMALQSDATVNYITGKSDPGISEADAKMDSPYNTYQRVGLTPTPICNPSLSSILASLNPTKTDYLYFLHDQKTGKAIYAKTYEEHLQNKQKYLR